MHYPRDVRAVGHREVGQPPHPTDPNQLTTNLNPLTLPRGLTLCEIEELNTADGSKDGAFDTLEEGEEEVFKKAEPETLKTEVRRSKPVNQKRVASACPRIKSSRSSPRCSTSSFNDSFRRTQPNVTVTGRNVSENSFRPVGAETVNLQYVPMRRPGSRQSSVPSQKLSLRRTQSDCTSGAGGSGSALLRRRRHSDKQMASTTNTTTGTVTVTSPLPDKQNFKFRDILSVDQKTLHSR